METTLYNRRYRPPLQLALPVDDWYCWNQSTARLVVASGFLGSWGCWQRVESTRLPSGPSSSSPERLSKPQSFWLGCGARWRPWRRSIRLETTKVSVFLASFLWCLDGLSNCFPIGRHQPIKWLLRLPSSTKDPSVHTHALLLNKNRLWAFPIAVFSKIFKK